MSKYVVTAIRVVDGEVEQAMVAKMYRGEGVHDFQFDTPAVIDHVELASLIASDEVFTGKLNDKSNTYDLGSQLRTKPGQHGYAISVNKDGEPDDALANLDHFGCDDEDA